MKSSSKDLSLGIERHIDNLGRVVIPKEMRDKLDFRENEAVNIKLFKNYIQIEKAKSTCCFCSSENNISYYKNHSICKSCMDDIIEKFNK